MVVVNCAGPWGARVGRLAGVDLPIDQSGALYLVEWSTSEGHVYNLVLRDGATPILPVAGYDSACGLWDVATDQSQGTPSWTQARAPSADQK